LFLRAREKRKRKVEITVIPGKRDDKQCQAKPVYVGPRQGRGEVHKLVGRAVVETLQPGEGWSAQGVAKKKGVGTSE